MSTLSLHISSLHAKLVSVVIVLAFSSFAYSESDMTLVWGESNWTGPSDLSADYEIEVVDDYLEVNIRVTDDVLVFSDDQIHSDHVEFWLSLPENKYTDQFKGFYHLPDLNRDYWIEPSAGGDILAYAGDYQNSGPNCLWDYFTEFELTPNDQWFGITHLGIMPSGSIVAYETEKLRYVNASDVTSGIAVDVTRRSDSQYSMLIKVPLAAVGPIPANGLESLRVLVDVIDVDNSGKQESLVSSSATRKWGTPATFNEIALDEPYVLTPQQLYPRLDIRSDYSQSKSDYHVYKSGRWQAMSVGPTGQLYGYDICSASVGDWASRFESTIVTSIPETYEVTVDGYLLQKIDRRVYVDGRYVFDTDEDLTEVFSLGTGTLGLIETNHEGYLGRFSRGPCAGGSVTTKRLRVVTDHGVSSHTLFYTSDCSAGVDLPEEVLLDDADFSLLNGDFYSLEDNYQNSGDYSILEFSNNYILLEFDISGIETGVIKASVQPNRDPQTYVYILSEQLNNQEIDLNQFKSELTEIVPSGQILMLEQCPRLHNQFGVKPYLVLSAFYNVEDVCSLSMPAIIASLEEGYGLEDIDPFFDEVAYPNRFRALAYLMRYFDEAFAFYESGQPALISLGKDRLLQALFQYPRPLEVTNHNIRNDIIDLIDLASRYQQEELVKALVTKVSDPVKLDYLELLQYKTLFVDANISVDPFDFEAESILSAFVILNTDENFREFFQENELADGIQGRLSTNEILMTLSELNSRKSVDDELVQLSLLNERDLTVGQLFGAIEYGSPRMLARAMRYEYDGMPLNEDGVDPIVALLTTPVNQRYLSWADKGRMFETILKNFDVSQSNSNGQVFALAAKMEFEQGRSGAHFKLASQFIDSDFTNVNLLIDGRTPLDHFAALDNRGMLLRALSLGGVSGGEREFESHLAKYVNRADAEVVLALLDSRAEYDVDLQRNCEEIGISAIRSGVAEVLSEMLRCAGEFEPHPEIFQIPVHSERTHDVAIIPNREWQPMWVDFNELEYGLFTDTEGNPVTRAAINPERTLIAYHTGHEGISFYSLITKEHYSFDAPFGYPVWLDSETMLVSTKTNERCALYLDGSALCDESTQIYGIKSVFGDGTVLVSNNSVTQFINPDGTVDPVSEGFRTYCSIAVTADRNTLVLSRNWYDEGKLELYDRSTGEFEDFSPDGEISGCPVLSQDGEMLAYHKSRSEVGMRNFNTREVVDLLFVDGMP